MTRTRYWLCWALGLSGFFFSYLLSGRFFYSILFSIVVTAFAYVSFRWRLILYSILGTYHLGALIFTYLVDGHLDLLGLIRYVPWFKYIAFLGILMIVVDVITYFFELKSSRLENEGLKDENTNLKARIYDMQESAKKSEAQKP